MSERTIDDERAVERDDYRANPDESGKWVSALIGLLGAWMIVEAVILEIVLTQFWNDVLVGALLLAVGGYNYYRRSNKEIGSMAAAAIAALLGIWLIAAPFILGADTIGVDTTNDMAFWNDMIVGLLALILGAYSAYEVRKDQRTAERAAA